MSLLGFDGFSRYRAKSEIEDGNWVIETDSGNLSLVFDSGPNERGALQFGQLNLSDASIYWNIGSLKQTLIMGFWFTFDGFDTSGGNTNDLIMSFNSSTSVRNSLRIRSDGSLLLLRSTNSTTIWDSSDTEDTPDGTAKYLFQGSEYKIEIRGDWLNTTGSFELRVNNEVWAFFSGNADLDGTINRIYFRTGFYLDGAQYSISDFYLIEDDGSGATDFLGDTFQVEVLRPTSDSGTESDFTPSTGIDNYALVDDSIRHDYDGTYISSAVTGNIDRYLTTGTLNGQRVIAASVIAVARHEGSADNFRLTIFEGATAGNGGTEALTGNFIPYEYMTTVNPDTSAEWTVTELEGCEFGVEDVA